MAIGTLVAMIYRTVYLAWYLRTNILNRSLRYFVQHLAVDAITVFTVLISTRWVSITEPSWMMWIVQAIAVGVIVCVESLIINMIFYRKIIRKSMDFMFKSKSARRKTKNEYQQNYKYYGTQGISPLDSYRNVSETSVSEVDRAQT